MPMLVRSVAWGVGFAVAAAVARLRRARMLHPRGRVYAGVMEVPAPGRHGARLLDRPGRHPVTVRLSKATSTPKGWPDVFGVAVRLPAGRGAGRPVDLLLSSSNRRPLLRHLFLPKTSPATFYGSLAAYRTGRHQRLFLGAVLDPDSPTVLLAAATRFGRWRPFARVRLNRRLGSRVGAALAFDPIGNTPADLRPVGLVQRIRRPVYLGSQAGRAGTDAARAGPARLRAGWLSRR